MTKIPEWITSMTDLELVADVKAAEYNTEDYRLKTQADHRLCEKFFSDVDYSIMTDEDKADLTGAPGELLGGFRTIFERLLFEVS